LAVRGLSSELQSGRGTTGCLRVRIDHLHHGDSSGSLSADRLFNEGPVEEDRSRRGSLFHLGSGISTGGAHFCGSGN